MGEDIGGWEEVGGIVKADGVAVEQVDLQQKEQSEWTREDRGDNTYRGVKSCMFYCKEWKN